MHIENQMSSGRGDIQEEINTSVHSLAGPIRSPNEKEVFSVHDV